MKILIVEDEEAMAAGLKFNFEQEGYDVLLAGDGPTALKLFRAASPPVDMVILDLMLPGAAEPREELAGAAPDAAAIPESRPDSCRGRANV
jgi:CheY-like chemotaxis protein